MGIFVYMACDEGVQDLLGEEEANEALDIRGATDDTWRSTLLEKIINTIATDTHIERITRKVDMFK